MQSRGGVGGAIGTEFAARAPPDGYTLYFAGGGQFSVLPLMQKLNYDPIKDLVPVSMVTHNGMAFAINADVPAAMRPNSLCLRDRAVALPRDAWKLADCRPLMANSSHHKW